MLDTSILLLMYFHLEYIQNYLTTLCDKCSSNKFLSDTSLLSSLNPISANILLSKNSSVRPNSFFKS